MKRLWIRVHALQEVEALARKQGSSDVANELWDVRTTEQAKNINAMVIVEISDGLADLIARDTFLRASGKVLAEGEDPPYVGSDPPLSEEELRAELGAT